MAECQGEPDVAVAAFLRMRRIRTQVRNEKQIHVDDHTHNLAIRQYKRNKESFQSFRPSGAIDVKMFLVVACYNICD